MTAKDREQGAFETWLRDAALSGCVEEVQRQWEASHALRNFLEIEEEVARIEAPLRTEIERLREHAVILAATAEQVERTRCAKICEDISDEYQRREGMRYPELKTDAQTGASDCMYAILKA